MLFWATVTGREKISLSLHEWAAEVQSNDTENYSTTESREKIKIITQANPIER